LIVAVRMILRRKEVGITIIPQVGSGEGLIREMSVEWAGWK
jgi:hypothetical protein